MRATPLYLAVFALALVALAGSVNADDANKAAIKAQYTFFNPTPKRLMRDMTTDRPDITESPFTIDAGHVQTETQVFSYARSRPGEDGAVSDVYEVGTTNVRIGLTNFAEVALVWQPYGAVETRSPIPGRSFTSDGVGTLEIRGKINFWGNDTFEKPGATAAALLPFIDVPTDPGNGISVDDVEGGFIVPLAIKLSEKLELGLNAGAAIVKNEDASGYRTEFLGSAAFGYEWTDKLGTYYEVAVELGTEDPRGDIVLLGTGLTYAVDDDTQLDAGINVGVTRASDRINPFVGVSRRF